MATLPNCSELGGGGELKGHYLRAELHRDVEAVEEYLQQQTGTVDDPAEYIHGEIKLYKAPFVEIELPLTKIKQSVAYFTGATSRTVLMLAGPLDDLQDEPRTDPTSRRVAAASSASPRWR